LWGKVYLSFCGEIHENIMSDSSEKKKKRPRGFASIIDTQLAPLNSSEYFKQKYGQDRFTLLLIATDDNYAAFVTVADGTVCVEGVKNKPEELKPLKYNGRILTSTETFLAFAMGKVNPVKAVLTGKLKIRGFRVVLHFAKYFSILAYIQKQQAKAKAEQANLPT
jgi:putative sterol carrier protein